MSARILAACPSSPTCASTQAQDTDLGLGLLTLYEVDTDNRRKLV
jgi:uncharacterized protein (DUF1499 family)